MASLLAHAFWTKAGSAQMNHSSTFFEHIGLMAGLVLAGWVAIVQAEP